MDKVKKLTGNTSAWVKKNRPAGEYWGWGPIENIDGTGEKQGDTSVSTGIITVSYLRGKMNDELKELRTRTPGISIARLTKWSKIDARE